MEVSMSNDDCIFCNLPDERVLKRYKYFFVIEDAFPVTKMHTLIIANRHVSDYFDLSEIEKAELPVILDELKSNLDSRDKNISGYNIGINVGQDAGQTVLHFHQHFIPRRRADTKNPRGGVRGVIAEKQKY
jgi:ATP adenylyltransferase